MKLKITAHVEQAIWYVLYVKKTSLHFDSKLTSLVILISWEAASAYIPLLFRTSMLNSVARVAKCGTLTNIKTLANQQGAKII